MSFRHKHETIRMMSEQFNKVFANKFQRFKSIKH
jgi:hypothetical protein